MDFILSFTLIFLLFLFTGQSASCSGTEKVEMPQRLSRYCRLLSLFRVVRKYKIDFIMTDDDLELYVMDSMDSQHHK